MSITNQLKESALRGFADAVAGEERENEVFDLIDWLDGEGYGQEEIEDIARQWRYRNGGDQ